MKLFNSANDTALKVKICGLANKQDIINCQAAGVHALGFLLGDSEGKSPTDYLTPQQAALLRAHVTNTCSATLLVKANSYEEFAPLLDLIKPNAVQVQSQSIEISTLQKLKAIYTSIEFIKTINIKEADTLHDVNTNVEKYKNYCDAILLDSGKGGSNTTHNWNISAVVAKNLKEEGIPVVLAGGLNLDNVLEAVQKIKPNMIDLMSGMSIDKGVKDIEKIKALMTLLKQHKLL